LNLLISFPPLTGNMWIGLRPPQLALYPSPVGPPGSPRPSSELHPGGQIHIPVSKCQGRHRIYFLTEASIRNSSLKMSKYSSSLFSVSYIVPYLSNHWGDVCRHYGLPRTPQGLASAGLEVSVWFLHSRRRRAGRARGRQRRPEGHVEFNAVHSHVTNGIRILHTADDVAATALSKFWRMKMLICLLCHSIFVMLFTIERGIFSQVKRIP